MKKLRFEHTPFDIAPQAPRYTAAAWRILGAGVFVLLACVWPLASSLQELQRAQDVHSLVRAEYQAQVNAQRAAQARLSEPMMVETIKAQHRLQQMVRMTWFGLFDALEAAALEVYGGVSILSLVPSQGEAEATQVSLTAVAANAPIMLEYIRVLRKDSRILAVELNSQQADDNVGPGVIRLQLNVLWNPQAVRHPPSALQEKSIDHSQVTGTSMARDPVAKVIVNKEAP